MHCLSCGHCCRCMSPLSDGEEPCPHLVQYPDPNQPEPIYLCGTYATRPPRCRAHSLPASICPVGADVLGYHCADQCHQREDRAWQIICRDYPTPTED